MQALNNVVTLDNYDAALTLEQDTADTLTYVIANASVRAKFRPVAFRGEARAPYGDEVLLSPQSNSAQRVSGVQFRSAIAGTPARVIAQLTGPGDPQLASGTPFTQTLSAAGGVSGGSGSIQRIALANFPPAAPADGDVISLAVATGIEWLFIFNASAGFWDFIGGPSISSEVATAETTASQTYVGLTTAGPLITVPRDGLYDVTAEFTEVGNAAGGPAWMSYDIGAAGAVDADATEARSDDSALTSKTSGARTTRKSLLAGTLLVAKYRSRVNTITIQASKRRMALAPVHIQ